MTTYTELQAELAEAIWNSNNNNNEIVLSPVSNFDRVCELLDAGVEPEAAGIARLIVFYREVVELRAVPGAFWRRREILRRFIDAGHIDLAGVAASDTGETWLHLVCAGSAPSKDLELLLEQGANTIINHCNVAGDTPLHCAMQTWPPTRRTTRIEIVTLLLNTGAGTDIHARNGWDATPLHFAAERADVQVIALLVNECDGIGDVINRRNAAGDTPLHIYLRGQFRPVVAGLTRLLEAGADPGLRDGKGLTPIDILQARDGAESLHAALIKLLLGYGCPEQAEARFQRQHPGSCRAIVLPS